MIYIFAVGNSTIEVVGRLTVVRMCDTLLSPTAIVTALQTPCQRLDYPLDHVAGRRSLENAMAYIRLPGGIKVAMEFEAHGKIIVNVYHVTTTDPIVTIKLTDIADVFINWWAVDMSANLSDEIALVNVTALNLDEENGEKVEVAVSPPDPGQQASTSVPNQVCNVMTLLTSQTGRSFRGRAYIAGLTSGDVDGNEVAIATVAAMVLDYADLQADLTTENAELVIASFISGGVPRATAVGTPVESVSANSRVDTQRRRLPTA